MPAACGSWTFFGLRPFNGPSPPPTGEYTATRTARALICALRANAANGAYGSQGVRV